LYGRILKTYPDPRFNYGSGSKVYTAEMEVYCSLKGSRVNQSVNISEAGQLKLEIRLSVDKEIPAVTKLNKPVCFDLFYVCILKN